MNIALRNLKLEEADSLVIPIFSDAEKAVPEAAEGILRTLKAKGKFKGEHGEIFTAAQVGGAGAQDLIFIGLGKEEELTGEKLRTVMSKALKKCRELKDERLYIQFTRSNKLDFAAAVKAVYEGIAFADYKFDKYKTDRKEQPALEVCIGGIESDSLEAAEESMEEAKVIVETTLLARDLVNEPANVLYPETLAEAAEDCGRRYAFEVEVLDEVQIEELEMEAFLSVAQGSEKAPRFIVMRYFGDEENKSEILGLVGKGLTYDSGGYSLKPNDGMVTMKCDMGGAAAVIGAISAIAERKLKLNVVAVIAACENMISGGAYKPGDIIGSMAGKTIEVLNTDAEGRLTLVDAVHYIISRENVSRVIDVATLTGAALVALGTTTTAVVTYDCRFYEELESAAGEAGENIWMLPAFEEYKKLIKSEVADVKNTGGRYGGTITAGLFIGEFVQNKPWLHLDIAGTAWTEKEREYYSAGGTGAGVRTLYYLAKNISKV